MRRRFSRILMAALTLFGAVTTHAANYQINVPGSPVAQTECAWYYYSSSSTHYPARQIAVSNGVVYGVIPNTNPGIAYYNTTSGVSGTISTGTADNGTGITTDDNKNIIVHRNIAYTAYGTPVPAVRVYKAASGFGDVITATAYKDIDLSSVFDAIQEFTQYMSASGNVYDGTGYLYFTDGSTAARITIVNGTATAQHSVTLSNANTNRPQEDYIKLCDDGTYLLQCRNTAQEIIPGCVIDWEAKTFTAGATTYAYRQSAAQTTFNNHKIFIHPSADIFTTTSHPLVMEVDGSQVATLDAWPDNTSSVRGAYGTVNAWCEFEQVDDNTLALYALTPSYTYGSTEALRYSCIVRYNITATELSGETVISTTPTWTQAASDYALSNPVRFQQPAVSPNGYLYLPGGNNTNYSGTIKGIHVFGNGVSTLISSGGNALGFGGAFDDNNHYVFHGAYDSGAASYDTAPTVLRVKRPCADDTDTGEYPYTLMGTMENNATFATLTLGDYAPGIVAKFFDATGDMATTGHIWWVPNETYTDQALVLYGTEISSWAPSKKLTISLSSLHGLTAASTGNNYIQFYDTSDLTRYRALLQLHGNGLYDVVINVTAGKQVSCTRIPDSSVANYMNSGAHIFMLNGHKLLARSVETAGAGSQANPTKFEIVDITDINNIKTLAVIQPTYGNNIVSGGSSVGTWLQSRKINDKTVELWAYGAGCGVEVYTITANITDAATITLSGKIDVNKAEQDNRQDAVLSWTSPAGYEVEEYKVYCTEEYTSTYNGNTLDKTYYVGSTTANTITHQNLHWIKGSSDWYEQRYTYTVYPVLADGSIGPNATITLTPDFLPCPPVWTAILTYDGYQKAQIYWSAPSWGQAPNYYNVYRDGVKLNESPILNYNYLDTQITAGDHIYYVEGFYLEDSSDIVTSTLTNRTPDRSAYIAPRDPMKTTYSIETIYNYRIGSGTNEVKPQGVYSTLTNNLRYKQGEYYRGNWYLMQQNNNVIDYSRILRFSADKSEILTDAATSVISFDITGSSSHYSTAGWSVGMAMDDAGNIFIRRGGLDSNGNYTTSSRIRYYFELGCGAIYLRNSDGSYSSTPVIVDLSQCQILDFDTQYSLFEPINNIYYGRVEYFNMTGDLSTVGGEAYLWVSASGSKRSNKIKLTRTATSTITATLVEKVDITLADRLTGEDFAVGVENYVFPVKYLKENADGSHSEAYRGDYIHNLRSRVYANIKPTNDPTDLTDVQITIYDTQSRVNQCGGTTIGWNNEIFLITPQCPYSQNSGNFYVSMGDRAKYDASGNAVYDENQNAVMLTAEDADLTKPIPVAQMTQADITDGTFSNSNGNWLYAALGQIDEEKELDIDFTDPDDATCVYIYQYIPGVRFAKYRLIPNNYFPPTPVDLEIASVYGKSGYRDNDLIRYDGTAVFGSAVDGNSISLESGNINYKVDYYTYTFRDAAGTDVWTYIIQPDGTYTYTRVKDGETTTGEGSGSLVSDEYTDIEGTVHDAYYVLEHSDLKRDTTYKSTVTVNYVNTTDDTDTHVSETTVDEAARNYTPIAPEPETVTVYEGQKDTSVEGMYRIEVNFDEPTDESGNAPEEPVSYYVVTVTKPVVDESGNPVKDENGNPVTVTETVTDFELMVNGKASDNGGDYYDYIPGDYDFDANEGYWNSGNSTGESTIVFYYTTPVSSTTSTDPSDWTYNIEAVYGGTNPNISAEASNSDSAESTVVTAVENIGNGAQRLSVFPVPARATVTVTAPEAIETIKVYSIAGEVVMTADGNGEYVATLDIRHLSAGYYLLEINGGTIVRIIKE